MPSTVEAPIVAVTVYPHHARITRRASARLDGETRFAFAGLPWNLDADSVRVTGSGPAVIAGVDVAVERHPVPADAALRALTERRRADQAIVDEVADAVAAETAKVDLLTGLAARSGKSFAKALAAGTAEPPRVAEVTDALGTQLAGALGKRRELGIRLARLRDDLKALDRDIEAKQGVSEVDSATVTVELDSGEDGAEIGLELSYVVTNASWEPGYDVRVRGEDVTVTWYGRITQHTGEDWPECELALSTARPANTVEVPELEPWFLDRVRPVPPVMARAAYGSASPAGGGIPESVGMAAPAGPPMAMRTATVEEGTTAVTYRPSRPVAVPSGAQGHRTTLAQLDLTAKLGYVTAPALSSEAYLRATVVNTSEHTLRPGKASVFHETEFVGTTRLDVWAPGEELELALGVDDRIRVERELTHRSASKATLSGVRKREASYTTTVTNHSPREAVVTVLDQAPVSRDEAITVREVRAVPEPVERTELGEFTWRLTLAPGSKTVVTLGYRVDVAKGVELSGWRE
ncbi:DUF4139 domain-containing protein [Amycolatopsis regifaucium]|uniref:Aspartate ammonia-lyase n=1 Tax=Amycolatopsis regifaucium TaxID=546365 RepID=A0A154MJQ9_9PSEU|nr:DUF4139 domain-containing protein [Amycolatopsis regifaucium]KZB84546.1 aspartate ammonia-lyase [Amycolatopsis regifaucium]OKA11009.1 aspartate ammonia-lyase [Amycolatopsis regifaucium]SFI25233.1 conserved hypothetical protein [Amycolatopsis regifaucium]